MVNCLRYCSYFCLFEICLSIRGFNYYLNF